MIMFASLISWWYGPGLQQRLRNMSVSFDRWLDFFSFGLIFRTLFAPFRQIDAGKVSGAIDVQFRAWLDRTFSRIIGFVVRIALLAIGVVWLIAVALWDVLQLIGWLLLPLLPLLGIVLYISGWVPWQV